MRTGFQILALGMLGGLLAALVMANPGAVSDAETAPHVLFFLVLLLALVFGGGMIGGRSALREILSNFVIWAAVFAGLIVGYANRDALRMTALRTISAMAPGHSVMISQEEAILTRERSGHFTAYATINGARVHMLIDTGATDIALPYTEARRIGIDVDRLRFDHPVMTANGRALVASVTLEAVSIGGITLENVSASVAEKGKLGGALLGMSFLSRLSEFSFQGDKLILRR